MTLGIVLWRKHYEKDGTLSRAAPIFLAVESNMPLICRCISMQRKCFNNVKNIVRRQSVPALLPTSVVDTLMENLYLTIRANTNRNGAHAVPTLYGTKAIAHPIVNMSTPQTLRTMVTMCTSRRNPRYYRFTMTAPKVGFLLFGFFETPNTLEITSRSTG